MPDVPPRIPALCAVALLALLLVGLLLIALAGSDAYSYVLGIALIPVSVLIWLMRVAERRYRASAASPDRNGPETGGSPDEAVAGPSRIVARFWGCWIGTVRVRPAEPDAVVRTFPINLVLSGCPLEARLSSEKGPKTQRGVVAVELLEQDALNGLLDLRVTVADSGRREEFVAQLVWRTGLLVSEDDSDPLTLELAPAAKGRWRRSMAARRAAGRRKRLAAAADSIP